MEDCTAIALMLLTELAERAPAKYNLARNAASLSPINIVENEEEYVVRYRSLEDKLHAANKAIASVSDTTNLQCQEFYLTNKTEYKSLWSIYI